MGHNTFLRHNRFKRQQYKKCNSVGHKPYFILCRHKGRFLQRSNIAQALYEVLLSVNQTCRCKASVHKSGKCRMVGGQAHSRMEGRNIQIYNAKSLNRFRFRLNLYHCFLFSFELLFNGLILIWLSFIPVFLVTISIICASSESVSSLLFTTTSTVLSSILT